MGSLRIGNCENGDSHGNLLLPCPSPPSPALGYRPNWHHEVLAEKLDLVAASCCRRLMVFMPPPHGKSELVSRGFPTFVLGRNPDLRPICTSHTNDLAVSQYVINRELHFKADSPGCRLLVEQLIDFPLAEHDDGPDTLEMCMRLPMDAMQ